MLPLPGLCTKRLRGKQAKTNERLLLELKENPSDLYCNAPQLTVDYLVLS